MSYVEEIAMTATTIEYQPRIREMPAQERPRERLRAVGAGTLTNAELLAILLRTGGNGENVVALATRLLSQAGGIEALGRASFADLCRLKGVGGAKAAQVLAGIELGRRIVGALPEGRAVIRCSDDIERLLRPEMIDLEREELRVLLLNARYQVTGNRTVYQGNAHSVVVRVGEVFREAVRENSTCIVVAHNHPSGDPTPSEDDARLTRQIVEAGQLLGIEVLDHVVIARGGCVSMKEYGQGFAKPGTNGVAPGNGARSG